MNVSILAEKLWFPQCLKKLIFTNSWIETGHVNEIFLNDANTNKILAIFFLSLAFLYFLLPLLGSSFFLVFLDVGAKFGMSVKKPAVSIVFKPTKKITVHKGSGATAKYSFDDILFRCHNSPYNGFFIVRSSTCRAQTIHVLFDVVETELADLIPARTWSKAAIRQIEFFDTKRTVKRCQINKLLYDGSNAWF